MTNALFCPFCGFPVFQVNAGEMLFGTFGSWRWQKAKVFCSFPLCDHLDIGGTNANSSQIKSIEQSSMKLCPRSSTIHYSPSLSPLRIREEEELKYAWRTFPPPPSFSFQKLISFPHHRPFPSRIRNQELNFPPSSSFPWRVQFPSDVAFLFFF